MDVVKQNDILTAINMILVELYPDYMVYIMECPKKFSRPSFKIELVHVSQRDINKSTIEKTVYYTITCFATKDDYYISNPEELSGLQDVIMQRLQIGYLTVGDRAIKVKSSTGGMDPDRAYIDLQFEYYDSRTEEADNTPLISTVSTKMEVL